MRVVQVRKEFRSAVRQYEQKEFETIAEKEEFDQIQFWKYINRKRGKIKTINDYALYLNNQIINGLQQQQLQIAGQIIMKNYFPNCKMSPLMKIFIRKSI